jgi:hypothetical protein
MLRAGRSGGARSALSRQLGNPFFDCGNVVEYDVDFIISNLLILDLRHQNVLDVSDAAVHEDLQYIE